MKKRVLKNIPTSAVDQVVADFKRDGCDPVDKEKQSNGKWTVTAQCPDEENESYFFQQIFRFLLFFSGLFKNSFSCGDIPKAGAIKSEFEGSQEEGWVLNTTWNGIGEQ